MPAVDRRQSDAPGQPQNPELRGVGLPEAHGNAEVGSNSAPTKVVFRPGLFQYIYALLIPGVFLSMGIGTVAYGLVTASQDWSSRIPASLLWVVLGLLPSAYVLGMRVESNGQQLSEIFLFGLFRETIPVAQLAAKIDKEVSGGVLVSKAQFMRAQGSGAFSLYRTWIWRARDVDDLLGYATQPWDPGSSMKRQNGRLIAILVLLGIAAFIAFLIDLGNTPSNGSIFGIPMH